MIPPNTRLKREAANALAAEIRESVTGTKLWPWAAFWERLGMGNPTPSKQAWLAEQFEARGFEFTPDLRRDAVYIVWRGHPSAAAKAATDRKERQLEEAYWRSLPDHEERWANFGVPNSHRTTKLRAISIPQPQAELVMRGSQKTLTRRWPTPFPFGAVLIHASKTWSKQQRLEAEAHGLKRSDLTFGAVIGLVEVVSEAGREPEYIWELSNPRRFAQSVDVPGSSGVFLVDAAPFELELWG